MAADGVGSALVFVTSAYSSYSACRQYQDDLAAAVAAVGGRAPTFAKIRHFFDHPGFIEPQVDAVRDAVAAVAGSRRATTRLVFTAHSIPVSMAEHAGPDGNLYVAQLRAAAGLIADSAAPGMRWDLVFQSRSGPLSVPWLEPDVNDHLRDLEATPDTTNVVVVPVGFVSDHLEVQWDLDVEAAAVAREVGLGFTRTPAPGTASRFAAMVRELVQERLDPACPKRALSPLGPSHDACPVGCCPAPPRH
jgi:ferrochelatase